MRKVWWFAIASGIVVIALLAALGVAYFTGDGGEITDASECPPPASTQSAGNAEISARAVGKGLNPVIVVRAKDKESGMSLHNASVKVRGTMTCPHFMPLIQRDLREASNGTYRGDYPLIMPGQWTINIVVRSENGEATTSALPLEVKSAK